MRSPHTFACCLCLLLGLLGPEARGQESAPSDTSELERAQALFEKAQAYYKIQKYEEALADYEEVYLLTRAPVMLFNIAQCYRLLGRREEALRSYRAFLADVPDTPYRREVEARIAELEVADPPPARRKAASALFFGGAALAGAAGLAAGGLFFIERGELRALAEAKNSAADEVAVAAQLRKVVALGTLADVMGGLTLLSGAAGVFAARHQRAGPRLSLLPTGLVLSGRF